MARYAWMAMLLLVLTGCGGGSGSGSTSSAQISGLTVVASSTGLSTGRGSVSAGASYVNPLGRDSVLLTSLTNGAIIDFTAPEGNIADYTLTIYTAGGLQVFSQQGSIANIATRTNGNIVIAFPLSTSFPAGNYSCRVSVSDTSGHLSNTLYSDFTVS